MRKIMIFIGAIFLSLALIGCVPGETTDTKTPPAFESISVANQSPLEGDVLKTFYREKESTIRVEIGLTNPYQYTITSIIINGYNYRFTKFEQGSDFETIILNIPVGSSLGDSVYTVEQIQYQDGLSTKYVNTSDVQFKVYVYKEDPNALLESYDADKESINMLVQITDPDIVIVDGTLKATIYHLSQVVEVKNLSLGQNTLEFTGLNANNIYEVKITASYDLSDGDGLIENDLLFSRIYSTHANQAPTADISNIDVTANNVTFDVVYNDVSSVTSPSGVSIGLYKGGILEDTLDITGSEDGLEFTLLLNDTLYELRVISSYDLADGGSAVDNEVLTTESFTTLPRVIPNPTIDNLEIGEHSVMFDMAVDDPTGIIDGSTIIAYIKDGDTVIEEIAVGSKQASLSFNNLLSNYNFTLEIRATLNLNDGHGDQENQVIYTRNYSTVKAFIPDVVINSFTVTQGYITINYDFLDSSSALINGTFRVVLLEDNVIKDTILLSSTSESVVIPYSTLFSSDYELRFTVDYDLVDGNGRIPNEVVLNYFYSGITLKSPIAETTDIVADKDSVLFNTNILDSDDTIVDATIFAKLYMNNVFVKQILLDNDNNPLETFDLLYSNTLYRVDIVANFNLANGSGIQTDQVIETFSFTTDYKVAPIGDIIDTTITDTSITVDVTSTDDDLTILLPTFVARIELLDGTHVEDILLDRGNDTAVFDELLSNTEYRILILTDYNLNENTPNVSLEITSQVNRTKEKDVPTATILNVVSSKDGITFDVLVNNDTLSLSDGLAAYIYLGEDLEDTKPLNSLVNNVVVTSLYSDSEYTIVVKGGYNLNEGDGEVTNVIYDEAIISTLDNKLPLTSITNVSKDQENIVFDINLTDADTTRVGLVTAQLFLNGLSVQTKTVNLDDNTITFDTLLSDTEYTVKILSSYNLRDNNGQIDNHEYATFTITTDSKAKPIASISNVVVDKDTISLDVLFTDTDGVSDSELVGIYLNDVLLFSDTLTKGVAKTINFSTLLTNQEYTIKVLSTYNLDDDINDVTDGLLATLNLTTLANVLPSFVDSNKEISFNWFSTMISYDDEFSLLDENTLTASLWYDGVEIDVMDIESNPFTFNGINLFANSEYTIKIFGNYNLEDATGLVTNGLIDEITITTLENPKPLFELRTEVGHANTTSGIEVTDTQLLINYDLTDVNEVLLGGPLVMELYLNGVLQDTQTLALLTNQTATFDYVILAGVEYQLVVKGDYYLRDNDVTHDVIADILFVSDYHRTPTATITNQVVTATTIDFDVDLSDVDGVLEADSMFAVIKDGATEIDRIAIVVDGDSVQFTGLITATEYTIEIEVDYDLNDGLGIRTDEIIQTDTQTTS